MTEQDETELFRPVSDDVVLMHGQVWRVRDKGLVCIDALTNPDGAPLGSTNWRRSYVGACGRATFADDAMGGGLSVVQVRCLTYPDPATPGGLRATRDILRTSSGELVEEGDVFTLSTRRTRYVFRRLSDDESRRLEATLAAL